MGNPWTCPRHGRRLGAYDQCPDCMDEEVAMNERAYAQRMREEQLELARRRAAEEGTCDCCGQRFINRTRVKPTKAGDWTGVLARHSGNGVCPRCYNEYGIRGGDDVSQR